MSRCTSGPWGAVAPVLPIVLYTGVSRWRAARRVVELATPGTASAGGGEVAQVGEWIIDCATGEDLMVRFGNGIGSGP